MHYAEVYTKYNLEKSKKGNNLVLSDISTNDLSELVCKLKTRIRELSKSIDELLDKKFYGTKEQILIQEIPRKRQLTDLSDEEYYSKIILRSIEDELIKRKRNQKIMSVKALNNGGVYTTGTMMKPRVGMGFKGYGGVCL